MTRYWSVRQAASASRNGPASQSVSRIVPSAYALVDSWYRYTLSATAAVASPSPSSTHARPGRQPVTAAMPATNDSSRMSPSGYVRSWQCRAAAARAVSRIAGYRTAIEGRDRQASDRPVQPNTGVEARDAAANEQDDAYVQSRIEGEVEAIRDRRIRDRFELREMEGPVDLADAPCGEPPSDEQPGRALAPDRRSPDQAGARGRQHDPVVDPVFEYRVEVRPAGNQSAVEAVRGQADRGRDKQDASHQGRLCTLPPIPSTG